MRRISVLGATGSIGRNTLDLVQGRKDAFKVVALTGDRNIAQLAELARALGAEVAVTADESLLDDLRDALAGSGVEAAAGRSALVEAAGRPVDWVMSAIVGAAGLAPGLAALEQGATLALANKESMVCAGPLMRAAEAAHGGRILPVDSEHSAIFQALVGEDISRVERVVITASGGAFRDWSLEDMARATPDEAARHPNWSMGKRITIDSASMFNKAMELIETHELFGIEPQRIETVIHPESIIHALVGFIDGGLMAHVGPPDMRHAIGYALNWPERAHVPVERIDLAALGSLGFRAASEERYPALRLAREVMLRGGLAGAAFNAAKETALDAFLDLRIGFLDMAAVVEETLSAPVVRSGLIDAEISLDTVTEMDHLARAEARSVVKRRASKAS